jgi:hypothetical protein
MHDNAGRNGVDRQQDMHELDLDTSLTVRQRQQLLAPWNARFAVATGTRLTTEIRFHARDEIAAFVSTSN